MNTIRAIVSKLLLLVVILVALISIAFFSGYFYAKDNTQLPFGITLKSKPSPTPIVKTLPGTKEYIAVTVTPTPPPTRHEGGIANHAIYTILVPSNWNVDRDHKDQLGTDNVMITNGNYLIKIYQANTGGVICSFEDRKEEGPLTKDYNKYVQVGEHYRRVTEENAPNKDKTMYDICDEQKGKYARPTRFGHIAYEVPANADENILKQMDEMILSLQNK